MSLPNPLVWQQLWSGRATEVAGPRRSAGQELAVRTRSGWARQQSSSQAREPPAAAGPGGGQVLPGHGTPGNPWQKQDW